MAHYPTEFANIKQLIAILKYKTFESKIIERTLDRLLFLAKKTENAVEITNAGAIPLLVEFLKGKLEPVKKRQPKWVGGWPTEIQTLRPKLQKTQTQYPHWLNY